MITNDVENYPGFEFITGPDLMQKMQLHAEKFGTKIKYQRIENIEKSQFEGKQYFILKDSENNIHYAWAIIIATGAKAKWLGLKSEEEYKGYGVSGCATCDAFFYKNKVVAVVGGGNTAVEEALFLTNFAKKVYLIHRKDHLKAEKIIQERLFKKTKGRDPQIEIIWNHVVDEVLGFINPENCHKKVSGIIIKNINSEDSKEIKLDGLFIAIGHEPNSLNFKNILEVKSNNYIFTHKGTTLTSCSGIFAAGDVQDDKYRQAITAAGTGCMAALDATAYLAELGIE
jgi:thioredoxin reductase (NADPH)